MKHITESKSLDVLTGHTDLLIYLPSGQEIKMPVDPRTPMLDLLIKICTKNNIKLSEHTLQPLNTDNKSYEGINRILKYKPNTMVGLLGTDIIKVVPKVKNTIPVQKPVPLSNPFQQTFRLKVYLPRNQLYVTRVSPDVYLYDILKEICDEKKMDSSKYAFRHPGDSHYTLDLNLKISDYQVTELYLVNADQISIAKNNNCYYSQSVDGSYYSVSTRERFNSIDSSSIQRRSITSLNSCCSDTTDSKTSKKKRPAPPPPNKFKTETKSVEIIRESQKPKNELTFTTSHSRNSSDSSGYHETSFLSDSCTTPPLQQHQPVFVPENETDRSKTYCTKSNLSYNSAFSKSVPNLAIKGRKKKAPPPPPPCKVNSVSSDSSSLTFTSQALISDY